MQKKLTTFGAGLAAAIALGSAAQATTLTYDITGIGSGELNGVSFQDAVFDLSLVADSANAFDDSVILSSTTAHIAGLPDLMLSDFTLLGLNRPFSAFYLSDGKHADIFDFLVVPWQTAGFSFLLPYGPVNSDGVYALSQFRDVDTSGGLLTFYSSSEILFTAQMPPVFAPPPVITPTPGVPEPATWTLMFTGFLALGGVLRGRAALMA